MALPSPAAMTVQPEAVQPLRPILAAVHAAAPGAHLVGGAVRDLLLGRPPADLDFTTTGDPGAAADAIAAALGGSAFGLAAEEGQFRVVLPAGAPVSAIDVSRQHGAVIAADLLRRDFTVNALAAAPTEGGDIGPVVDATGLGLADLAAGRVRLVSEEALTADPLRLLRAARLAVELSFSLEEGTAALVRQRAGLLTAAAPERLRDELARILATPRSAAGVRLLDELGLLDQLLPELAPGRGVTQPGAYHYGDVFQHSVETLAALDEMTAAEATTPSPGTGRAAWLGGLFREGLAWYPLRPYLAEAVGGQTRLILLKLAGLLHDVAKPETKRTEAGGRVRFFGHAELGAAKAARVCERLRFGGREGKFVARLVEEHLRPTQLSQEGPPSQRAVHRFFRDLGGAAPACLFLSLADAAAAAGPRLTPERWRAQVAFVNHLLRQAEAQAAAVRRAPRLVTGNDLMEALHLPPGPLIGQLLAAVEEAIATGEVASREEAIAWAARVAAEAGSRDE